MNILKVYISKTGNKLNTENLILNQNSYYNTLQLYTETYYPEVVCTFKNSNGDLSPKCHMIYKGKQQDEKYLYEYPIPFAITSFVIPNMSGRLETSFVCYENKGNNLVYPTVANTSITVNKSNGTETLDASYNGTDVENLWKIVGELLLRSTPDGGGKQDQLIPGKYIEITDSNVINVLPINYSYITDKPLIPTKMSQLEQDIELGNVSVLYSPSQSMPTLKGLTINGDNYKLPAYDLSVSTTSVPGSDTIKNIHFNDKDYAVGGITDAEKQDIQDQLNLKANKSEVYDINVMDSKLNLKADKSNTYTKADVNAELDKKADKDYSFSKNEITEKLNLKADKSEIYTQTQIDDKLAEKVDTKTLTDNYYTSKQVDDKLTSALVYKGSVATVADLPKTKNKIGDFWNVLEDDVNYAWDGKKWDKIGGAGTTDLSDYYTIEQVDAKDTILQNDINTRVLIDDFNLYKQGVETKFTGIDTKFNDYYTSTTIDDLLLNKANKNDVYDIATVDNLLSAKQPVGDYALKTDFKTINNENIIGSGNIEIKAGSDVFANVQLVGNEDYLESLQVSGSKYKVGYENMTFSETAIEGAHQLRNINIAGDNWGIPEGGSDVVIDPSLNADSQNPVSNSAITNAINSINTNIDTLNSKVNTITVDELNGILSIE